jgi:hypothetical protein
VEVGMKDKIHGGDCINLEYVRMQRQIDMLAKYFPHADFEEIRGRSPEKNRELINLLMLYVNASDEERAALHAHIEKTRKRKQKAKPVSFKKGK